MEQIEKTTRWSLNDLLAEPVDRALTENFSKLEQAVAEFEAMHDSLTSQIRMDQFNKILAVMETVNILTSRIEAYSDLLLAEDTQNPNALNLRDRVDQVLTDTSNRLLFFDLWFKDLPDDAAKPLMEQSGDLRYFLEAMRQFKPFTLSEVEEKMINLKDVNGIDAMINLYEMITNKFEFTLDVDGERQTLTRDQLGSYFRHPSAAVREAAYH